MILGRNIIALLVPSGSPIQLHKGTSLTITQSLGNSFTVEVYGNLVRVDGKDADALGQEVHDFLKDLADDATLEEKINAQLKTVYDPEISVNIVDLGLVYHSEHNLLNDETYAVSVAMTLTSPGCGMGPTIAEDARQKILMLPEVSKVEIDLVFDPPWNQDMMSDEAKLTLGML